jgi:hypothetical protein
MRMAIACAAAAGMLVGCAAPTCQRLVTDTTGAIKKACGLDGGVTEEIQFGSFDGGVMSQTECTTAIKSCSAADQDLITNYLVCLEAVPQCTSSNFNSAASGPSNCVEGQLADLSAACTTAFGGSDNNGSTFNDGGA